MMHTSRKSKHMEAKGCISEFSAVVNLIDADLRTWGQRRRLQVKMIKAHDRLIATQCNLKCTRSNLILCTAKDRRQNIFSAESPAPIISSSLSFVDVGMGTAPSYFTLWLFCMTLLLGLDEASGWCLESQKALLVKLNQSLITDEYGSPMLSKWNSSSDCCDWPGVTCNNNGYVTGLDLSYQNIYGPLPDIFSSFGNLTYLDLAVNGFSGRIPESLAELKLLSFLDVKGSSLEGSIPNSFTKLTSLEYIDLSRNNLSGPIPVFSVFKNLTNLNLRDNRLTGSLAAINWSELSHMRWLDLSHNNLNGTFQLDKLQSLKNLSYLSLSYNNLSIDVSEVPLAFPLHSRLSLASCKLKAFPKMVINSEHGVLESLDLSANQITGLIPEWTWNIFYLNLSYNNLYAFETPLQDYRASYILLNSNKLQGKIPNMPFASVVDLSRNLFESSTFSDTNNVNISAEYFSVANNYLRGRISQSMCHFASKILDLSNNFLSGEIPRCLVQQTRDLIALKLANNVISGVIPNSFPLHCSLRYLNFNGNNLHGDIPMSLGRCRGLEVLDLGNNTLQDVFPCWMRRSAPNLMVLVLWYNLFYGSILCSNVKANWRSLQVINIASNNFNGSLPSRRLAEWMAMITNEESKAQSYHIPDYFYNYQFDSSGGIAISLTVKGTLIIVERIISNFIMIDFSANAFQGPIPNELGHLKGLRSLNVSYNRLTGQIPTSLGNLRNLETLDLRNNALTGRIPVELSSFNNLEVLNLSFNQLEGMIPRGPQFQTFDQYCYVHNKGLWGFPLPTSSREETPTKPLAKPSSKFGVEVWISAEVGFALGLGFIIMPLVFWPEWRRRFYEFTDNLFCKLS